MVQRPLNGCWGCSNLWRPARTDLESQCPACGGYRVEIVDGDPEDFVERTLDHASERKRAGYVAPPRDGVVLIAGLTFVGFALLALAVSIPHCASG